MTRIRLVQVPPRPPTPAPGVPRRCEACGEEQSVMPIRSVLAAIDADAPRWRRICEACLRWNVEGT